MRSSNQQIYLDSGVGGNVCFKCLEQWRKQISRGEGGHMAEQASTVLLKQSSQTHSLALTQGHLVT